MVDGDFYADSTTWLNGVTNDLQCGNVDSEKVIELWNGLSGGDFNVSKKMYEVVAMLTLAQDKGWFDD